jgi:hypothetical protein
MNYKGLPDDLVGLWADTFFILRFSTYLFYNQGTTGISVSFNVQPRQFSSTVILSKGLAIQQFNYDIIATEYTYLNETRSSWK